MNDIDGTPLHFAQSYDSDAFYRQSGTELLKFTNIPAGLFSQSQMWNIQPPNRFVAVNGTSGRSLVDGKSCSDGTLTKPGAPGAGQRGVNGRKYSTAASRRLTTPSTGGPSVGA